MPEDVKTLREAAKFGLLGQTREGYASLTDGDRKAFHILCRVVADMIEREDDEDAYVNIQGKPAGHAVHIDQVREREAAAEDRGWNKAIDACVAKLESTLKHYLAANPSANHTICAVLNQEAGALRRLRRTERGEG